MADDKKLGRMVSAFGEPDKPNSIIKVIGVGGGGGNAVNHMYKEGIHDVTFVLCNTDKKALDDSPVPVHLQLGEEGLGAGNDPETGKQKAEESEQEIRNMLNDGTKMVFITAGMGGGTGTGAGPEVARIAKSMDILTVGIVTIPFKWEGKKKILQALAGVERMAKNVDALLVINNERLFSIYGQLSVEDAFGKADDTLSVAAKSIAEIITMHGIINLDFNDVKTVLKNGGVALMSTGFGEGEDRMKKAINNALHSPLLNDNDVYHSKKILLSVSFSGGKDGKMNITDKLAMSAADLRKKREQEQAEQILIQNYYGNTGNGEERFSPRCFIFSNEDLDNDNLISAVETTPTYKRSKIQYDDLVKQSKGDNVASSASAAPKAAPVSGTIKFM